MAYTRGRCTNVDYCSLAAAKRDVEVRLGEEFICPECARPLRTPPAKQGSSGLGLLLGGAGVAGLLIAGGIYVGYRLSTGAVFVPAAPTLPAAGPPAPVRPDNAAPPSPAPPTALPRAAPPAPPAVAVGAPVAATPSVILRMAGSTAMGTNLAPRLASAYLTSLGDTAVSVAPGPGQGETVVKGLRSGQAEIVTIMALSGPDDGTAWGLDALRSGQADVALASRKMEVQERDKPRGPDGVPAAARENAVAREGAAILVNPHNPLEQISLAQLRFVLEGGIATWSPLGGPARPIHVLRVTGTPAASDWLAGAADGAPRPRVTADAAAAVLADPDAIALVPWGSTGSARVLPISQIGAPPASPSAAGIGDGSYPLYRSLYLYAPSAGSKPSADRFVAFALSAEGQNAVAQAGLVPVHAAETPAAIPAVETPKDRYKQLVTGATRLAADLHFEPGANTLDLHSAREVDRVWNFMMSDHTPADHLIIIGFADNSGTPESNSYIAKQRAQAVADVFTRRGLAPGQVLSFGSDLPLADNATEEGRLKNRRVEVFLRP